MGEGLSELSHQPRLLVPSLSGSQNPPFPTQGWQASSISGLSYCGPGLGFFSTPAPPPSKTVSSLLTGKHEDGSLMFFLRIFFTCHLEVACACAYTPHAQAPRYRVRNAYNKPTKLRSLHKITVPSNSHIYVYKYICTQVSHIHLYMER